MPAPLRLLITGSRTCTNVQAIHTALDEHIFSQYGHNVVMISGAARGADRICEHYARLRGWGLELYHANWKHHGRRAGYLRSWYMVTHAAPDLAMAFYPGTEITRGTQMTVDLCAKNNVPMIHVPHC